MNITFIGLPEATILNCFSNLSESQSNCQTPAGLKSEVPPTLLFLITKTVICQESSNSPARSQLCGMTKAA